MLEVDVTQEAGGFEDHHDSQDEAVDNLPELQQAPEHFGDGGEDKSADDAARYAAKPAQNGHAQNLNRVVKGKTGGVHVTHVGGVERAGYAVLIPELLEGLPFHVFATSSIDALVHAVESVLSPKATPYTKLFSYRAMEMIIRGYQKIAAEGKEGRISLLGDFLIASNYAGLAFGTAGCAAVHATSYPLSGKYHVAHGESNYVMFTGVLKNYREIRQDGEIAVLNEALAGLLGCGVSEVYEKLEELLNQILPKKPLHTYGVMKEDLPEFAHSVITNQGRLMGNNFVPLDEKQVLKIYRDLY